MNISDVYVVSRNQNSEASPLVIVCDVIKPLFIIFSYCNLSAGVAILFHRLQNTFYLHLYWIWRRSPACCRRVDVVGIILHFCLFSSSRCGFNETHWVMGLKDADLPTKPLIEHGHQRWPASVPTEFGLLQS